MMPEMETASVQMDKLMTHVLPNAYDQPVRPMMLVKDFVLAHSDNNTTQFKEDAIALVEEL
jgi:hypothetical protein